MAFLHAIARFGRADLSFLVFAAFFAVCVAPSSGASGSLHSHHVLLWLSGGEIGAHSEIATAPPAFPAPPKAPANPVFSLPVPVSKTPNCAFEAPELAFLNGVRTNRRLN